MGNWRWTASANINPFLWIRCKPSVSNSDNCFSSVGYTSKERSCICDRRWTQVKTYKENFSWEQQNFSEAVYFGSLQKGKRNPHERKQEMEQQQTREVLKGFFTNPFKYQRLLLKDHFWLCLLVSFVIKICNSKFQQHLDKNPTKLSLANASSDCIHPCHTWRQAQPARCEPKSGTESTTAVSEMGSCPWADFAKWLQLKPSESCPFTGRQRTINKWIMQKQRQVSYKKKGQIKHESWMWAKERGEKKPRVRNLES